MKETGYVGFDSVQKYIKTIYSFFVAQIDRTSSMERCSVKLVKCYASEDILHVDPKRMTQRGY